MQACLDIFIKSQEYLALINKYQNKEMLVIEEANTIPCNLGFGWLYTAKELIIYIEYNIC